MFKNCKFTCNTFHLQPVSDILHRGSTLVTFEIHVLPPWVQPKLAFPCVKYICTYKQVSGGICIKKWLFLISLLRCIRQFFVVLATTK